MEQENQEALKEFLLDIDCLEELQKWGTNFNLFDVLKVSRTEIRHSNILAWLLNPNENHNIGDAFIKKLLKEFIANKSERDKELLNLLLIDFKTFSVYREWKNIDILLFSTDEKIVIAIENKVGSHEHSNQLNRYKEILEKEFREYKKILIYLTPEGEEPSDEDWNVLTYENIVENLEAIRKKLQLSSDVALMIDNYIEVIRRNVMEDRELIEVCNKIYNKHKKALDLIFEYRTDPTQAPGIVKEVLQEMSDRNEIIYDKSNGNTYIHFYTHNMNNLLPDLIDKKGSWGNEHAYAYEFKMMNDKFRLSCVLTAVNLPEQTMNTVKKILEIEQHRKTDLDFKWRQLHLKKYNISEENYDNENIANVVRNAIKNILSWEKEIIEKLKS